MTEFEIHQYLKILRIKRAAVLIVIIGLLVIVGYTVYETYFNGPVLDQLILK